MFFPEPEVTAKNLHGFKVTISHHSASTSHYLHVARHDRLDELAHMFVIQADPTKFASTGSMHTPNSMMLERFVFLLLERV
jgi:hypothetical protein